MFPTLPVQSAFDIKRFQPSSVAFSTGGTAAGTHTHTNDAQAYDASPSTAADLNVHITAILTGVLSQIATYSAFGTGTYPGIITVFCVSNVLESTSGTAITSSSIALEYSINGGGAWLSLASISGSGNPPNWVYPVPQVKALSTPVDLSLLQIRATVIGSCTKNGADIAQADADLLIYDISFS